MDYPEDLCLLADKMLYFSAQMLCRLILKKKIKKIKIRIGPLTALTKKRLMLWIYLASCLFLLHPCSHLLWKEKLESAFVKIRFLSWTELNHESLKSAQPDKGSAARRNESARQLLAPWMSPVLQTAAGISSEDCPLSPVNEGYCLRWLLATEFNTGASNLIPAPHGPAGTRRGGAGSSAFPAGTCASLWGGTDLPRPDRSPGAPRQRALGWASTPSPSALTSLMGGG